LTLRLGLKRLRKDRSLVALVSSYIRLVFV